MACFLVPTAEAIAAKLVEKTAFKDNEEMEFVFYENCSKKAYETYIDLWGNHNELAFNEEKDNYELIED